MIPTFNIHKVEDQIWTVVAQLKCCSWEALPEVRWANVLIDATSRSLHNPGPSELCEKCMLPHPEHDRHHSDRLGYHVFIFPKALKGKKEMLGWTFLISRGQMTPEGWWPMLLDPHSPLLDKGLTTAIGSPNTMFSTSASLALFPCAISLTPDFHISCVMAKTDRLYTARLDCSLLPPVPHATQSSQPVSWTLFLSYPNLADPNWFQADCLDDANVNIKEEVSKLTKNLLSSFNPLYISFTSISILVNLPISLQIPISIKMELNNT